MENLSKTGALLSGPFFRLVSRLPFGRDSLTVAGIILVGLLVRLAFIDEDIRYDEAQTFNLYVSKAPGELFHMSRMNNHVFHSLFVWVATLFAGTEPWALRLPAFGAGVVAIFLTFRLSRLLNDEDGGLFSAAGMAVFPFMVLFSTNARGYTLITCFVLLLAISILKTLKDPDSVSPFRIALITAFGIWTNLSMVYPAAGLMAWFFIELFAGPMPFRKALFQFVLPVCTFTLFLTSAMYAPTLLREGGFDDVFHNPVIKSLPANEFFSRIPDHFEKTVRHLFKDVSMVFGAVAIALAGLGVGIMTTDRKNAGATLLISMLIGTGTLFLMKRSFPFTRNWMFVIPIFLVYADAGFTWLVQRIPSRVQFIPFLLLLIPVCSDVRDLIRNDTISQYNDTGRFPEVLPVTSFLAGVVTDDDVVVAQVPHNEPLDYYLRTQHPNVSVRTSRSDGPRNFVVVREGNHRNQPVNGLQPVFKAGKTTVFVTPPENITVTGLAIAED